jgi:hypothetical protein
MFRGLHKSTLKGAVFNEVKMLNLKETVPGPGNSTIQIEYGKGLTKSFKSY